MSTEKFDLHKVHEKFTESLTGDDDVYVDQYLEAFKELYKFFQLMGTVFGFVSSDVKEKVEILEKLRAKENAESFLTIRTMMEYERESNLLSKKDYVSGSRTLLRLHRGLDFIQEFLRRLGELDGDGKTNGVCQAAYNDTLAQFHPWLIRKGANVAMYALPNRDQLLDKVCMDATIAIKLLPDMLSVTRDVYNRTQDLYTKYDLHGLP
ncbi:ceramide-1-phosphate transfer protein [Anopheles ziemanni]|uniref:ceramide-1-phosphate transfer protein n=1 Tax=Anopheles coustani TaxID=139045 RepID=UPI00265824C6|nr:ceramide-1-phosphate transfer protein [Anopheles coustani]XP_058178998.1 ceramide-1-phosphate transfer protein [Anopheles ziemanni]